MLRASRTRFLLTIFAIVVAWCVIVGPFAWAQQPMSVTTHGNGAEAIVCDTSVAVNITSATTTQLVALVTNKVVYVCGGLLNAIGNATVVSAQFVYGTGASCGTGTTNLSGPLTAGNSIAASTVWPFGGGLGYVFKTAVSNGLCLTSVGTAGLEGWVTYTQF